MDKKLRLSNHKIIGGVCGGIAEYFNVDQSFIRILWVVIALATQVAPLVILYIVCWAIMPKPDKQ